MSVYEKLAVAVPPSIDRHELAQRLKVSEDRIEPLGINENGEVLFRSGRFGFSDSGGPTFFQQDENILWKATANGNIVQEHNAGETLPPNPMRIGVDAQKLKLQTSFDSEFMQLAQHITVAAAQVDDSNSFFTRMRTE